MDPEQLERARAIFEALSSTPGFSATLTQQAPTHSASAHANAAPSASARPQGARQTAHTHSAAGASSQPSQPRRGATQPAARGGIPAALSRYRPIKPKPAPPSLPHTSTSAAPSPVPSNAAPPLFPALAGLPSIPAGPLPPLPPPPVLLAHTVLPLATGHGPFSLLAPFTMIAPPAMSGQMHAPAQPAPLAMSAHWTTQLHGTAQMPPPPAPAASTLPPAPTTTVGGHAAGAQVLDPLPKVNQHGKRARADEHDNAPIAKRAAIEERRQALALDSAESSSSVGPRVQSRNNILPQQHSHTLQISPPPQATGSAPLSAPIENGNSAADPKGKGRAVTRRASPETAQDVLFLPPGRGVRRAAGAAQATTAPAPAPAPAPAAAPAAAMAPAPAPAAGHLALAAGGVRGTTIGRLATVKRTTAAPQPGSRGPQGPAAPAAPSGNAAASGSHPHASASSALGSAAVAGPSHPPTAQGGAAAADEEETDEEEDEEADEDEGGRKKGDKKKQVKKAVDKSANALGCLQAGLKWYSWMAPN